MLRELYPESATIEKALDKYSLQDGMVDLILAVYGITGKTMNPEIFDVTVEHFHERCDYTMMNTNMCCLYSALLEVLYERPSSKVYAMTEIIEVFRETGFRSRISNMQALVAMEYPGDKEELAIRALTIYRAMHEYHSIITGEDDYVAATFLAMLDMPVEAIMDQVEHSYKILGSKSYARGNGLQSLTHELALTDAEHHSRMIPLAEQWNRAFRHHKIYAEGNQVMLFGLLAELEVAPELFAAGMAEKFMNYKKRHVKLSSLDKMALILEAAKGVSPDFTEMDERQQHYIRDALLLMVTAYLFRERMV